MIVGAYLLDLYCEFAEDAKHRRSELHQQFISHSRSAVIRQAKAVGWKVSLKKGKAVCPKCSVNLSRLDLKEML